MNNLDIDGGIVMHEGAMNAIDNALDATPDRDNCEAWYEAMEAVLLWQYPDGHKEVKEALNFIRDAIDERWNGLEQKMANRKNKPSNEPGYRPIGIDQFSSDGETYYLTEADCLEPVEGWGNEEWSDEDVKRENGDDWD